MKHLIRVPLVLLLLIAFSSNYAAFANRLSYGRLKTTVTTEKKKQSIASATKEAGPCRAPFEETNCFTDCLKSWDIPPEAIAECAGQCAGGNVGQCAACLGVGIFIVAYCAYQCAPPQTMERLPKKLRGQSRSNTFALNRVAATQTQGR